MTTILLIIGVINILLFRKDWKKLIYFLIIMVPFFGYIQLNILHLTPLAALLQDITFIIPLYVVYLMSLDSTLRSKKPRHLVPQKIKTILFFFVLLITIYTINPFYDVTFLARMIGVKVWIFYLLFIFIGFDFIENKSELKKFCKFFAVVALIPSIIGIAQYISTNSIGYKETMTLFYFGNDRLATLATQGWAFFDWGYFMIYRLPSTFVFSAQFNHYTVFALVPAFCAFSFSKYQPSKFFYFIIIVAVILGIFSSGLRGSFLFLTLFLIFYMLVHTKLYFSIFSLAFIITILNFVNLENFPIFYTVFSNVSDLTTTYSEVYIYKDFINILSDGFWGNGVGSATAEARYAQGNIAEAIGASAVATSGEKMHEGYFHRTVLELGIVGLFSVIALFSIIVYEIVLSIKHLDNEDTSVFCKLLFAFTLLTLVSLTKSMSVINKFPVNFLFFFFVGIAIKIKYLKSQNEN